MKLLKSPNRWSCLLTSFAMALDTSIEELINEIGHDGSEVIWPDLMEPFRRRAFHPNEFINSCFSRGYAPVTVDPVPIIAVDQGELKCHAIKMKGEWFTRFLLDWNGVLIGEAAGGKPHAVSWNGHECLDPAGLVYPETNFSIREFIALVPKLSS